MDTLPSGGSAKRRRLDGPVSSQLHKTSVAVPNADVVFHTQPVSQGNILDTGQIPVSCTSTIHPSQRCNSHPSQHHQELPPFRNDFDVLLSDHTLRSDFAPLYNNALDTYPYLDFDSFRFQLYSEDGSLSIPNLTNDHSAVANDVLGNDDITIICYGMVSILRFT